ncbi:MAG: potassium transporter, partial [Candidatus Portiera sp.]|nr:potassium transporter [Portiera sp.]
LVGLSPALGTFLAGVVLANSEFRRELESNIEPFKGILLALFFITIGASIDFNIIYDNAFILAVSTLGLIFIKGLVLFIIANIYGIKARSDRWLFTLSLAQAGEFGFVLLAFATQNSVLPPELANLLIVVVALSMLLTPLVFLFYEKGVQPYLESRKARKGENEVEYDKDVIKKGTVIIAGHGRFGQVVDRILLANGYKTTVLEYRATAIDTLRKFGVETFYGDAARLDLLHAAGIADAKMFIVAIDDAEKAVELVNLVRRQRPDIHIIARAWDRRQVFKLYRAGANDIVREVFDSSVRTGRYALEALGMDKKSSQSQADIFAKNDMEGVRKLAQVWDPDIPLLKNEKFVAMTRELRDDIEQAMRSDSDLKTQITRKKARVAGKEAAKKNQTTARTKTRTKTRTR